MMELIEAGQRGQMMRTVGAAAGVDEDVARAALLRLLPPLARRFSERAGDPVERQALLEVIASGGYRRYLDDPRALLGRDAIRNGEEALTYLYGSVDAAREQARAIGPPAGLEADVFGRLTTLAACLLLAGMAQRREQFMQAAAAEEANLGAALKGLGQAALRGFLEGSLRAARPLRRSRGFSRRMEARRRSLKTGADPERPSIDDLLGDLLQDGPGR